MREDYLWDGKGHDPEIEKLENALRVFRYLETSPPALPAEVIPFRQIKKERPRRIFSWSLAAAACLLAMVGISAFVWLRFSTDETEISNLSKIVAPQNKAQIVFQPPIDEPKITKSENIDEPKRPVERKVSKIRQTVPNRIRQNQTVARNIKNPKPEFRLTDEEKYAYNQLMLALSITSSKLKIVRDRVEGVEESNAVFESRR